MWGRFEGKTAECGAVLLGTAFFLLSAVRTGAQDLPESIERIIEIHCENGGSDPEELAEYLYALMENPLDLNTASREELEEFPLMTAFMTASLLEYREEFGQLASFAELSLVDGFGTAAVETLMPFVTLGRQTAGKNGRMRPGGRLRFRTGWNLKREGDEPRGLPVPLMTRFEGHLGKRYKAGFTLESDAGESSFPDFRSFYIAVSGIALSKDGQYCLESAVAGDFSLRFGQGLVLWNGFSFSGLSSPSSVIKREGTVRPYSSVDENNYFHGAGITIAFPYGFRTSIFYSDNGQDARIEGEYFVTKPEDGLHDSDGDMSARDALREQVAGGNVSWCGSMLKLGVTAVAYRYDRLDGRRKSYYNSHLRYDGWWGNASADFLLSYRGLRVFGEAAVDRDKDFAAIAGAVYPFSSSLEASVVFRYYSKDYIAAHAGAYCRSSCNNEHGVSVAASWAPSAGVDVSAGLEYTYFPFYRYGVRRASASLKGEIDCTWAISRGHSVYFRASGSCDDGREERRMRLRAEYSYVHDSGFGTSVRAEGSLAGSYGGLVFCEAGYSAPSGCLRTVFRITAFMTGSWDSRIYSYENDVPGSFSVPAWYGKGTGLYLMLTYRPVKWCSLSFKFSAAKYSEPEKDNLKMKFQLTLPF